MLQIHNMQYYFNKTLTTKIINYFKLIRQYLKFYLNTMTNKIQHKTKQNKYHIFFKIYNHTNNLYPTSQPKTKKSRPEHSQDDFIQKKFEIIQRKL